MKIAAVKLFAFAVCAFLLWGVPVNSQKQGHSNIDNAIEARKSELERIQSLIDQKNSQLRQIEKEEKNHLDRLMALEEELSLNNQLVAKIDRQIEDVGNTLARTQARLSGGLSELKYRQQLMEQRLIWIYQRSRTNPIDIFIGGEDLLMGVRRQYYLSLLNSYDKNLLAEVDRLNGEIKIDLDDLASRQTVILRLKDEKSQHIQEIQNSHKKRKKILAGVRNQKDAEKESIRDLQETQRQISGILDELAEQKATPAADTFTDLSTLKGKLIWPVEGKIIRPFGKIIDKKHSTTLINAGIDINSSSGNMVKAAAAGVVSYISWLRGYGSFIIIEHGGGYYTLYAHLDGIGAELGQTVGGGEKIGTVGTTGAFGGSSLHFELRQGKEQLDPEKWLR